MLRYDCWLLLDACHVLLPALLDVQVGFVYDARDGEPLVVTNIIELSETGLEEVSESQIGESPRQVAVSALHAELRHLKEERQEEVIK